MNIPKPRSARLAFGLRWERNHPPVWPTVKAGLQIVVGLIGLLAVLSWMNERDLTDRRLAAAEQSAANLQEFVEEAKAVLAKCTSPTGGMIWIGDELHLCGAAPSGIKR